jgi:hypothetical protein
MLLVLSGDKVILANGQVYKIPAEVIEFQNYLYTTENDEIAQKIESSYSFGKDIWKVDEHEVEEVEASIKALKEENIRGTITAANVTKTPVKFTCEMCGKSFDSEKALRFHKISHRNDVQGSVKMEEKTTGSE